MAASVATYALYPLEVLRVRHQATVLPNESNVSKEMILQLLQEYSSPSLVLRLSHTMVDSFLYYVLFSKAESILLTQSSELRLSIFQHFLLSQLSSMLVVVLTRPLERMIYKLQTSTNAESNPGINIYSLLEEVCSTSNGLAPSLLLCANPAIHFTVYDACKVALLEWRSRGGVPSDALSVSQQDISNRTISPVDAFIIGIISKTVATLTTYPLIRAKVVMMSDSMCDTPLGSPEEDQGEEEGSHNCPSVRSSSSSRGSLHHLDTDPICDGDVGGGEWGTEEEDVTEMDDATKQRVADIPWLQLPVGAGSMGSPSPQSRSKTSMLEALVSSVRKTMESRRRGPLADVVRMVKVMRLIASLHGLPSLWKGLSLHLLHTVLRDALTMVGTSLHML